MRARHFPTALACVVAGVGAAYAGASSGPQPLANAASHKPHRTPVNKSPDLWATINVCDTEDHPNTIGIRGSMPGLGKKAHLEMRFRVQYQDTDGAWHFSGDAADSGFKRVGTVTTKAIESGQDFTFEPPATGAHTLRGVVDFQYKRNGRILKALRRISTVGHRSTAGADPSGYSAQTCQITAP